MNIFGTSYLVRIKCSECKQDMTFDRRFKDDGGDMIGIGSFAIVECKNICPSSDFAQILPATS